ncbi:NHL repeat-containing protein [candidate division KSB1 bacterium]
MMKNQFKHIFVFALIILISSGAAAQEIKTIDGVKTVINKGGGKWGGNPEVSIEFVRNYGNLFGEDENLMFYLPSDLVRDRDGNVYILDAGNFLVKKFSPLGEYLFSFGGEGQGPGELSHPASMNIDSEGNIIISDQGKNLYEVFSTEGRNLRSYKHDDIRTRGFRYNSKGEMVMPAGGMGGGIIIMRGPGEDEEDKAEPLFRVYNNDGEFLREIGEQIDIGDRISNMMVNNMYFCIDGKDNIYLTYRSLNRIQKYSPDGKLEFRIERPLNYSVKEPVKAKVERSGGNVSINMPEMTFVSNAIAVDSKGRIWVCTANRQMKDEEKISKMISVSSDVSTPTIKVEGNTDITKTDMFELEIFSPEGVLQGKFELDHFVDGIKIYGDSLYLLDENRGMQYYEYRIIG